jgi:hypothetical protein
MSVREILVSMSKDSTYLFHVEEVDHELRLYEGPPPPVLSARKSKNVDPYVLRAQRRYGVLYNNNDGGSGVLHFQIIEVGTHAELRHEMNLRAIHSPEVIEFEFRLRRSPKLRAP